MAEASSMSDPTPVIANTISSSRRCSDFGRESLEIATAAADASGVAEAAWGGNSSGGGAATGAGVAAGGSDDADLSAAMGSAIVPTLWQQAYLWEKARKSVHSADLAAARHYGIARTRPVL
jgi:hypothetical protein